MKITKFEHACLLVEMPEPISRTALFDPGVMSESALRVDSLEYLDDIIITHIHPDHLSMKLMQQLVAKFPDVRITAPAEVVAKLAEEGITQATDKESDGLGFFTSPHENVQPLFPQPQEIGVHYLKRLSHPGDSHSFNETMPILALPLSGPWASMVTGINLAIKLKPKYILPIHDWHFSDAARAQVYPMLEAAFAKENITFRPMQTGEPIVIEV